MAHVEKPSSVNNECEQDSYKSEQKNLAGGQTTINPWCPTGVKLVRYKKNVEPTKAKIENCDLYHAEMSNTITKPIEIGSKTMNPFA